MDTPITKAPAFDAAAFEDSTTADYRVRHPLTGEPTDWVLQLAGPEHPERKALLHARQRRMRQAVAKTGQVPLSDPVTDAAEELERLVTCTVGWSGGKVPYSAAAARELYADPKRRWLCTQVAVALEQGELFIRASSAS